MRVHVSPLHCLAPHPTTDTPTDWVVVEKEDGEKGLIVCISLPLSLCCPLVPSQTDETSKRNVLKLKTLQKIHKEYVSGHACCHTHSSYQYIPLFFSSVLYPPLDSPTTQILCSLCLSVSNEQYKPRMNIVYMFQIF